MRAAELGAHARQSGFDPLAVQEPAFAVVMLGGARRARYLDLGDPAWRPLVFFGGLGTSAGAALLTEFARPLRERLALRLICVERPGFGATPFEPRSWEDHAADVLAVLDALGVETFAIVGISGGGPFAAALAARAPRRVISVHLAAAAAGAGAPLGRSPLDDAEAVARDPASMWELAADSQARMIPGFAEAAARDGLRALPAGGSGALAIAHERRLLASEPLPDLSVVYAPAYLYWGGRDRIVPPAHIAEWSRALAGDVVLRGYDREGHDVQYRHWDQILVDASGLEGTLICYRGHTRLVRTGELPSFIAAGATLGLCAWTGR